VYLVVHHANVLWLLAAVILVEELVTSGIRTPRAIDTGNLLIPQKSKTEETTKNAEVRYTADTRPNSELLTWTDAVIVATAHNFNLCYISAQQTEVFNSVHFRIYTLLILSVRILYLRSDGT